MRRLIVLVLIVVAAYPQAGVAQQSQPKSPAESLKCMRARPGFTVELMAAEPLVKSPIAFAWGPDGKFWVVEMGDYPLGVDGKGKPGGRVKFLEKTKPGDGPYDKATVFLDGLSFPTGVTPYGKGVLITCAPDIFYAEDTDGDGKADKKEILFTGFREGNPQHRVNGLVWGLDNWFYGANGDSGGKVKSLKTGKIVDISGRDFRLKPDTGEFETATGQTQFGRSRDDWGNWFGNNNSNPMFHFVLEDRYLRRNPFLLPPDPRVQVSVNPGASVVYPISKPQERFNSPQSLNHFTSACSAIIYRDDLFGPAFEGNSFVSEPVHNLIHREVLKPKGVTFTSQRAADEQKSEFLASSDNWFRPTTIATGPDGALWVADMCRQVIEHPEWIPKDWQKKLDLRAGQDQGRIYRIFPKDKLPRAIVRLDKLTPKQLAALMESPNGWTRDMAQQLLVAFREKKESDAIRGEIIRLLKTSKNPKARIQALGALNGLAMSFPAVNAALQDSHSGVRKFAVACIEQVYPQYASFDESLPALMKDPDPKVRLQLVCTLGSSARPASSKLLAELLCQESDDRFLRAAAHSSVTKKNASQVLIALADRPKAPLPLIYSVLRITQENVDPAAVGRLIASRFTADLPKDQQFTYAAAMLDALDKKNAGVMKWLKDEKAGQKLTAELARLHDAARAVVANPKSAPPLRKDAAKMLARGIGNERDDHKLLAKLLTPQTPDDLQGVAIQALSKSSNPLVARMLLTPWKGYSPALRSQALDALLARRVWTRILTDSLRLKDVPPSEIDTPRRQQLLEHADAEVRATAAKVFAKSSSPNRGKLVDEYILTLPEKADAARGAKLFAKTCAACHKLGDVGQQVGPDLASVADKSVQGLLAAILDPNRAVEARYVNYLAITKDGRTLNGMVASETSTSVTLVGIDGKSHALLRNQIEELTSTGKSMMPEGLEKDLPIQEMADLIAFIRGQMQKDPRQKNKNAESVDPIFLPRIFLQKDSQAR